MISTARLELIVRGMPRGPVPTRASPRPVRIRGTFEVTALHSAVVSPRPSRPVADLPTGAALAHRLKQQTLKYVFAVFLVLVGLNMIWKAIAG